jgi:5'-3' exonuclease
MKINCIIDGLYLLYRGVFILKKHKTIYSDLDRLLNNDYVNISKSFSFDKVYFVSEKGKSWRKLLYKEYKANRKKDEKIDWEFVFKVFNDFKENLSYKKNIKMLEIPVLEGDDIISYIVRENNKKGISNVVISADADLHQFVKYDIIKDYINFQWNYKFNNEITYFPSNYPIYMEHLSKKLDNDIFEIGNEMEFLGYIESLTSRTRVKEIKCEKALFTKIITGDKNDNIHCVVNQKGHGIGEIGAEKIYNMYKETYEEEINFSSDIFKERVVHLISYAKKIPEEGLLENLNYNIQLIHLDEQYVPENIFKELEREFKEKQTEETIKEEEKNIDDNSFWD